MIARALVLAALLSSVSLPARATCYAAYIHGKLNSIAGGRSNLAPGSGATDSDRRDYWRNGASDTFGDFVLWSGINAGCTVLVTGYDGTAGFWDAAASGAVAAQLNQFISQNQIPDGQLILIGHSMGGLVARWIVNNGVGGAAYYNYNGDYATIARKTKNIISVSGAHLGSPVASAAYGSSDTICGNFVGTLAGWLGARDDSTYWLTTLQMEYGSASGSWMGDVARSKTLYTMATRRWDSGSNGVDALLKGAWDCLGYVAHWYQPWKSDVPGDGVVFEAAGAGQFRESGSGTNATWGTKSWSNGQWVQGARRDWVRMNHNHEHSRKDDSSLTVQDNIRGVTGSNYPGSYVRAYGLALP